MPGWVDSVLEAINPLQITPLVIYNSHENSSRSTCVRMWRGHAHMCGHVCAQVLLQRLRTSFGQPDSQVLLDEMIAKLKTTTTTNKNSGSGWRNIFYRIRGTEKSPKVDPPIYEKFVNNLGTVGHCERPRPGLLLGKLLHYMEGLSVKLNSLRSKTQLIR